MKTQNLEIKNPPQKTRRSPMRTALISMGILLLLATPALAGRNANGALVVHTDDSIVYTSTANYCATAMPATCEALGTQTNKPVEETEAVIWFVAAFMAQSSPGVTTIQFGIHHNLPPDQGYISTFGACGPSPLELPDAGWPEPNDCGNLVAYATPIYERLFAFYWFAAIGVQDGYLGTRTYPSTDEAKFVDDGSPPIEDLVFSFGTVRWGSAGANTCPTYTGGACCFADGHCANLLADECIAQGGDFQGTGTVCDPNPCPVAWGACCFGDGHCEILDANTCVDYNGVWYGMDEPCDPNPCPQPPEACCYPSGNCSFVPPAQCEATGGTPMGAGTTCDQIACKAPAMGACCLDEGVCLVTDEEGCAAQGGIYHADVACEPNPCGVPVEPTTWGSIKASFR
jgi:hypothetical protein